MSQPSENSDIVSEHQLQKLLHVGHHQYQGTQTRQQNILQGIRWLTTLQELLRLYLVLLPKTLFDLFSQLLKK